MKCLPEPVRSFIKKSNYIVFTPYLEWDMMDTGRKN